MYAWMTAIPFVNYKTVLTMYFFVWTDYKTYNTKTQYRYSYVRFVVDGGLGIFPISNDRNFMPFTWEMHRLGACVILAERSTRKTE